MKALGLNEIREKYLSFFESKAHLRLPSFSLIPQNDPSVLLINAGMTPMKRWFTGAETPPSKRVTTCQKCIRTPDIERVGHTARHGTYFEMLGNFSFGDYFKNEIIQWSWEFCTEVLEMPADRIYVTVYQDDDEAWDIWHEKVGLEPERIFRFGKADNFWEHGVGPCGPCSELYFDRGIEHGCGSEHCTVGCECDRYVEFWNLVFTQFNRDENGNYTPLEHKNIDTGAGLERFACIMQNVGNLFEVDTVRAVLDEVCRLANVEYGKDSKTDIAIRVITDHIRSTTMMISDGVVPGNEGRGYVLRRLLRRACRYGRLLSIPTPFLEGLAKLVIRESGDAYPNLIERESRILGVIRREEDSFEQTIQQGLGILSQMISEAKAAGRTELSGEEVFRLHDTYGFPRDLSREIAAEEGLGVDEAGFDAAMKVQKERGRKAQLEKTSSAWDSETLPESCHSCKATHFVGYQTLSAESEVLHLIRRGDSGLEEVEEAAEGDELLLIFAESPFYAESGGQVGDQGEILSDTAHIQVLDTQKNGSGLYLHSVKVLSGSFHQGDVLRLEVDKTRRLAVARNHSSTHLLHRALRHILGDHVEQAGSLVSPERLRFDFRHFQAMTADELRAVETEVNKAILEDYPLATSEMTLQEAKQSGATALFSEKYGSTVRVVSVGDYSSELCGGTHLSHSSEACLFRILSESGIASGVRRIEAVTGTEAYRFTVAQHNELKQAEQMLKAPAGELEHRIQSLLEEKRALEKELEKERAEKAGAGAKNLLSAVQHFGPIEAYIAQIDSMDADNLRKVGDSLRDRSESSLVILATVNEGRVLWLGMAGKAAVAAGANCGSLVKLAAQATGGNGGGRPDMAQAGGQAPDKVEDALAQVRAKLTESFGA